MYRFTTPTQCTHLPPVAIVELEMAAMSVLEDPVPSNEREKGEKGDESSLTDNGVQSPKEEVVDGGYGVSDSFIYRIVTRPFTPECYSRN